VHLALGKGLRELFSTHQVYIGAMNTAVLHETTEKTAMRVGREFSLGFADLNLSDPGDGLNRQYKPSVLWLLSHALLNSGNHCHGNLRNLNAYTVI
jgi:hypothetical protein